MGPLPMSAFAVDETAGVDLLPDRRRLALRLALVAAVLAALAFAVSSLPGLTEVRERLSDAAPGWLIVAAVAQMLSCLAFVAAFRGVFCRRLPWRLSYEVGMAAQGTNVLLPSGGAGGLGQVLAALGAGIGDAVALARAGNPLILAGAIGFMAFDLFALGAAFAALGALPPLGVLALAYVLGQLGGLIPLPGGVGGADGGLIAALALYGTPLGTAAAAVLAYRAFQLGLPPPLRALAVVRLPRVLEHAPDVGALCEPPRVAERAPGVGGRCEPRVRERALDVGGRREPRVAERP